MMDFSKLDGLIPAVVLDYRSGEVLMVGFMNEEAWDITRRTLAYTNHTLLPEALETWGLPLFQSLLPRPLEIIYEINRRFLDEVRQRYPGDGARVARLSLIDEAGDRCVRMANLATVGSHAINGVASFSNIWMEVTGSGLAITASSPALQHAEPNSNAPSRPDAKADSRIASRTHVTKRTRGRRQSDRMAFAVKSLFAWQSPTTSLLTIPDDKLLNSLPRLGESLQMIKTYSPEQFN